ncbi:hypothetical protein [Streptomyces sp. SID14515]|uniref:hypothetical protein n=1 Tax=Streptomyces sp. SID14515 TaxID=2706074 RepID=UPI0013C6D0DB|nr:hypothetical protein [Streptomyces sp. SID14515]NEB35901.1 hypothetical protein [Streptomyces sp. SID14515]
MVAVTIRVELSRDYGNTWSLGFTYLEGLPAITRERVPNVAHLRSLLITHERLAAYRIVAYRRALGVPLSAFPSAYRFVARRDDTGALVGLWWLEWWPPGEEYRRSRLAWVDESFGS